MGIVLKRKIIAAGNSRAVIIPSEWLDYHENKLGHKIEDVTIELNDSLVIKPDEEVKTSGGG